MSASLYVVVLQGIIPELLKLFLSIAIKVNITYAARILYVGYILKARTTASKKSTTS